MRVVDVRPGMVFINPSNRFFDLVVSTFVEEDRIRVIAIWVDSKIDQGHGPYISTRLFKNTDVIYDDWISI